MTIDLLCNLFAVLCLIVLASAWIWGVHGAASVSGFAAWFKSMPTMIKKPVFDCPVCMPTVHAPFIFFVSGAAEHLPLAFIIFVWIGSAGLNYIIKEHLYK